MDNQLSVPLWVANGEGRGGEQPRVPQGPQPPVPIPASPAHLGDLLLQLLLRLLRLWKGNEAISTCPGRGTPSHSPQAGREGEKADRTGPYLSSPLCAWGPSQG